MLGPHRLICGDSTSASDVERLLKRAQPSLMVTDPPYGIELDSEWRDRAGLNVCGGAEPSYMKKRTEGPRTTNKQLASATKNSASSSFREAMRSGLGITERISPRGSPSAPMFSGK